MKLGVKLAMATTALVIAVVVSAILFIGWRMAQKADQEITRSFDDTSRRIEREQRRIMQSLGKQNRVLADEPRLKAVVNTAEIDAETITDTARDTRDVAQADLLVIASPTGAVRASVAARGRTITIPAGYIDPGAIDTQGKELSAAWPLEGEIYLVAGHAVALQERISGILISGLQVTDAVLGEMREPETELILVTQGRITAAAIDPENTRLNQSRAELITAVKAVAPQAGSAKTLVTVNKERYYIRTAPVQRLDAARAGADTYYVMVRSLDRALRDYYDLRKFLVRLLIFAGAVAVLASLILASTLTRRVGRLASATAQVAAGDLDTNVPIGGRDEIGALGRAFNDMIAKLRISREELRSKERLERELEIATVIQTLLLPAQPTLDGFDVAARMVPAEEVGGDFYDLHQATGGSWIAIGDVSGHGVTPGLIMMMVQSMLSAIARQPAEIGQKYSPRDVLRVVNAALFDNLRTRMHDDNYMTMVLIKHVGGGKFTYAGAHESILVYRRSTHQVETLSTDGTWLGLQDDIGAFLEEHEVELEPGDALILYTDGITEAKNPQGVQYNIDRLRDMVIRQGSMSMPSAQKIRDGIIDDVMSWSRTRQDDVTVLVLRRLEA